MTELIELSAWAKATFKPKPPSLNTLYRMCREGEIPARKIGGAWYVHSEMTDRYLGPASEQETQHIAKRAYLTPIRARPSNSKYHRENNHLTNIILSRREDNEAKK